MEFHKYHALGNDYLVLDPTDTGFSLTPEKVALICHRHYGIGSDGILWGPLESDDADFGLRIFNPDGSEAEKSGNGLRIFSRYLWDRGLVKDDAFTINTPGGKVESRVSNEGRNIQVHMGRVLFSSRDIPVSGPPREVLNESLVIDGEELTFSAATIGNPHCVVLYEEPDESTARRFGPLIEIDGRFPNRTNVQFMKILDRKSIFIEIWERGAGYTLASGSSSSAAAAVAYRLGLTDEEITVNMPGGKIEISIGPRLDVLMRGPVTRVAKGVYFQEMFEADAAK